jgi:site-specific recombinase XerD
MLRHACGYNLADDSVESRSLQACLGHANIQNTARYTAVAPDRFRVSGATDQACATVQVCCYQPSDIH